MKYNKKQLGFTILEIMVVLVIIGILAGMIAPQLIGQSDEAKIKKAAVDITTLENALDMYKLKNHKYPSTEQGLDALVAIPDIEPIPKNYPEGGFIKRLPQDPWDNEYQLVSPGEQGKVDIFSMGPDGEADTEDDIGNWNIDEYLQ
ncbi:type II secretion system major pseudopilin GspG [Catenovulum sp. SM1970]|uniref:type II secretion system major pseudopilin GspG n=1 Tax=Marinifaba aquimaris TaxID=2741323 RepID=UPI0015721C34|nr:type II secretion system major pseudopilin GspG [Marinifaba aquimaris]NTS75838.1 type II secretion system major pseudopilin GspG [Marinifaba aquimaris]